MGECKKRRYKYWTDYGLNFLRENYNKYTKNELAKRLRRPFNSIATKARELGLMAHRDIPMKRKDVLARKVLILRLLRKQNVSVEEICKRTGLLPSTIKNYVPLIKDEGRSVAKKKLKEFSRSEYNQKYKERKREYYEKNKERIKKEQKERYWKTREKQLAFYHKIGKINRKTGKPY